MIRRVLLGSVLGFVMAVPPAGLLAQFNPYGNRPSPYAPSAESGADPRVRRAQREQVVAALGPNARDFVETQGDEAVAAIFACSRPVAVKLAGFYESGELNKLPRPRDLLRIIAQPRHGDDIALWAIQHASELTDTDSFDAYLQSPLEYALGLKQLAAGAAEARARRLTYQAAATPAAGAPMVPDWRSIAACGGVLTVVGLVIWWRRRRQAL